MAYGLCKCLQPRSFLRNQLQVACSLFHLPNIAACARPRQLARPRGCGANRSRHPFAGQYGPDGVAAPSAWKLCTGRRLKCQRLFDPARGSASVAENGKPTGLPPSARVAPLTPSGDSVLQIFDTRTGGCRAGRSLPSRADGQLSGHVCVAASRVDGTRRAPFLALVRARGAQEPTVHTID
jgi:hypothetical protein